MAIGTVDQLVAGFTGARQKLPISKAFLANMLAGGNGSYWRSAGFPAAGAIPGAASSCNQLLLGALNYNLPSSGLSTYIARLMLGMTAIGTTEIHDRLGHMGGLSGVVTTSQPVGLDLNALATTDNIGQRKGRADFATVQWWVECYTQTGATAGTLTVYYTNHLGVAGVTSVNIPANFRPGALLPIIPVTAGDNIRSVDSVTLFATTGTAGNFGVTATVQRTEISCYTANIGTLYDWTALGLPPVYDNSCLMFISNNVINGSAAGLNGAVTLVQG